MKAKKTPQANLENKKKSFFLFGLLTSLGFIFMAFEWAAHDINYVLPQELGALTETEPAVKMVKIIRPKPQQMTPPKTQDPIIDQYKKDKKIVDTAVVVTPKKKNLLANITIDTTVEFGEPTGPTKIDVPFKVVEQMPVYGKGDKDLFSYLGKKIKYTQYAKEIGVEGIVYIQFVVEKDGSITNTKIVRGIEPSLDNMALKTIQNMGKWNPGKQRGKAVRVQQVIPINFQLK